MLIKRLSIKNLTITILIVIALISVLLSYISGDYFFKVAREAQLYSLNRVIQVATKEIMNELRDHTYTVASTLAIKGTIPEEFSTAVKTGSLKKLIKAQDEPFITGFVGVYVIELVKVRTYDLDLHLVAESSVGLTNLPNVMPDTIFQQAHNRKGSARTKAVHGLWQYNDKSYYSVLVPLGGIFISGYLEIVVNPVNNLVKLSEKMDSPVSIRSGINSDKTYFHPEQSTSQLLPIEYTLKTRTGSPAYILTSYEDIAKLSEGVRKTVINTVSMFIGMVLIILFISVGLFQLFLFKPMNMMLKQIKDITDGDFSRDLSIEGLAEIDLLASEFNKMSHEVRSREEALTQLAIIDGLTQIPNRRKFEETLKHEYLTGCRTSNPLSVLLIDIDYFKRYNDTYGHLAGDDALQKVAKAIQDSVYRPDDLVARYGGEEFAVILPNTPENGEVVVAEKIMSQINKLQIEHSGSDVNDYVTVSIGGYTLIPSVKLDPAFIVAEADKSLYQAKAAGRNQFLLRSASSTD